MVESISINSRIRIKFYINIINISYHDICMQFGVDWIHKASITWSIRLYSTSVDVFCFPKENETLLLVIEKISQILSYPSLS